MKLQSKELVEVTFIAKNIKVTKKMVNNESKIERFRQDMLMKFDLLFKKEPHCIKIKYI